MEDKVIFERQLGSKGNVLGISIPEELQSFLELKKGDTIQMVGDTSKKGRFIAIWKK